MRQRPSDLGTTYRRQWYEINWQCHCWWHCRERGLFGGLCVLPLFCGVHRLMCPGRWWCQIATLWRGRRMLRCSGWIPCTQGDDAPKVLSQVNAVIIDAFQDGSEDLSHLWNVRVRRIYADEREFFHCCGERGSELLSSLNCQEGGGSDKKKI